MRRGSESKTFKKHHFRKIKVDGSTTGKKKNTVHRVNTVLRMSTGERFSLNGFRQGGKHQPLECHALFKTIGTIPFQVCRLNKDNSM